ncbi:MAG TPA: hypothetical protein VN804_00680 [Solirubrobacteraceae bacterium]|nr:hypothetical protein [Solirubrobacteraceae bacterium]
MTTSASAPSAAAAGGLEVRQEVLVRLHGDDLPFLRPDLLEQREQQFATLRRLGLQLPEALEVAEQRLGALDARVGRRAQSLRLPLDRLTAHHVLRSRQVAEHVEVLQPRQLAEQLVAPRLGRVDGRTVGFDGLDDQRDQPLVGLEVADPLNELTLQALGVDDPLAAGVAGAPRRAHVATGGFAAAARSVHARAAALAAQQLGQQVFA